MSKIKITPHIYLNAFRRKNALKQKDLAEYLGVTDGFISLVEHNRSKLSDESIDKLIQSNWDTSDLIPAYYRLQKIDSYVKEKYINQRLPSETLEPAILKQIKYGKIGFTDPMADAITDKYPVFNKQWLVDGTGDMLTDSIQPSELDELQKEIQRLKTEVHRYRQEIKKLLETIPELTANEILKQVNLLK